MIINKLLNAYESGKITGHECVVSIINQAPCDQLAEICGHLPEQIRYEIVRFSDSYHPGRMAALYGEVPSKERMEIVRQWISGQPAN